MPALRQAARVVRPDGHMLVYTTVATDLLEPGEAAMLSRHLGNVTANLAERTIEAAFDAAGLAVDDRDVIGSEWHEYLQERTQPVSRTLLRLSRLRRQRESIIASHGGDIYRHIEANLHWEVFLLLGKLCPIVYLLRPAPARCWSTASVPGSLNACVERVGPRVGRVTSPRRPHPSGTRPSPPLPGLEADAVGGTDHVWGDRAGVPGGQVVAVVGDNLVGDLVGGYGDRVGQAHGHEHLAASAPADSQTSS